jgi:outer membrane lipoprotein-sorting protein
MNNPVWISLIIVLQAVLSIPAGAQETAYNIVKKADEKMRGEKSSVSTLTMEIIRPTWTRSVSFKSWTLGADYSLVFITAPAKEKGQSFLKRKNEMWNWNPAINRVIKLPPSMLAQGWMGSDFTNDDLLNQSSIVVDYTHSISGSASVSGKDCHIITLIPEENAPVVWGKIILWISKADYLEMKAEYYDEDAYLVKTETASMIKNMDGRSIATRFELVPSDKPGNRTIVTLNSVQFNTPLTESFFSQQNLQKIR